MTNGVSYVNLYFSALGLFDFCFGLDPKQETFILDFERFGSLLGL